MTVKQLGLTAKLQRFIASEIKAGRYRNESEVVQAGLEILKQHQKYQKLKAQVRTGVDDYEAGRYTIMKSSADIKAHGDKLRALAGKGRSSRT